MFWECHVVTSSIEKLLDQPVDEIKLQDLLDENDLIQECLNQNKRLLDYLVQKNIMTELIHHIITLPNDNNFRNANVVSELLSGDFQRIQETLLEKENLDLLYSFLTINTSTLNPILASFFARIIITLLIRKSNEIINYFKSCQTFKNDFLNHLDSTSITDILYRLISDSGEQRSDAIKWYEEINIIDGLMQQFLITESKSIQINIANLLNEFLRLAFEPAIGIDCDFAGPALSATIERLLYNRNEYNEGSSSSRLSSSSDDDKKSINNDNEGKLTPVVLAQHILSKSNLEQLFDTLITRPIFITNGCDFLDNVLDLLSRHMPVPICISLVSKDENEQMEINDEGDNLPVKKTNENEITLTNLSKDPLVNIYLTLLEIIPTRLPSLINLLTTPSPPLIPSSNDTLKYQFISEPLGSMRLNLLRFFSKLISTISNDYTGDKIYEILNSNRLFHILIDLFLRHIYNNFLHTQVYLIIRHIIHINSLSIKQSNDIWTRTKILNDNNKNQEFSISSPFHYTNRCSYKLFQSLLNPSEVNLFERLFDQYDLNIASTKTITTNSLSENDNAITSSVLHARFSSPNSGHIAQILRYLRDHASVFNNYSTFFKTNDQEQIDDDTNLLEIRWQTALDYLTEDEKKWSAMHNTERSTNNFRINSSNYNTHDNSEANQRRQTFHMRSFGTSGTPYVDDEDEDDEIERFDIDNELMKNDQTTNEKKVVDMKNISFEPQFAATFNEQSLWYQQDDTTKDNDKMTVPPTLPDLFENHRNQQEKNASATESNFEQLCSIRTNDNGSGLFPFQSSSTIRDEAISHDDDDVFWQNHPIYLANSTENQYSNKSRTKSTSSSSSSDENSDMDDEDELKIDSNIPDDEKFFDHTNTETNENIQSNNMMDIFRRQSSSNNLNDDDQSKIRQEPILSSTPERDTNIQISPIEHQSRKVLTFGEQDEEMNNNNGDDDDDLELQDNFSFLIAKGMLKPS